MMLSDIRVPGKTALTVHARVYPNTPYCSIIGSSWHVRAFRESQITRRTGRPLPGNQKQPRDDGSGAISVALNFWVVVSLKFLLLDVPSAK